MSEIDATPEAVDLAEEYGIDLEDVEGSGAGGRILKPDVEAYIAETTDEPEDEPITPVSEGVKTVREGEGHPIWLAMALYETKFNEGSMSVFKMTMPPRTTFCPPHAHAFDEFALVTKGLVVEMVDESRNVRQEYALNAGDMIFLPAGTLESFRTLREPAEMYWFMIGDEGTSEAFFALNGEPAEERRIPTPPEISLATLEETRKRARDTGFADVP